MKVYIIRSKKLEWYYVGITSDIEKRLEEHNKGNVKSTKARKPYKLIYTETCTDRKAARKLEKKLKNSPNKRRILKTLNGDCSSIG